MVQNPLHIKKAVLSPQEEGMGGGSSPTMSFSALGSLVLPWARQGGKRSSQSMVLGSPSRLKCLEP